MSNRIHRENVLSGLVAIVLVAVLARTANAVDWPQWGGPNRDFKTTSGKLADKWPESGPTRLWERALGPGYSTVVAVGDRLYTAYRDGNDEIIIALSARTGETVWEHRYAAPPINGQVVEFGRGPNATPLVVGDRVITIGFTGKMNCLATADGEPIWSHDLRKDFFGKVQEYGYSSSPTLYQGHIIALVGGAKNGVVALNPEDGSLVWASKSYDISYASPKVIHVDGQDQVVFFSSTAVIGLDASNGHYLWEHPVINQYHNNATDVIWGKDNRLWVSTQVDGGTRVLKLSRSHGKTRVQEEWFNEKVKVFHWNAVRVGDYVYASIGGRVTTLAAVDIKTGKVAWRERGFDKALCVYADDKLISLDEAGTLRLARVSPQGVTVLSSCPLTDKVSWTVPTLVGTTLYVRDTKRIMALDLG